MGDFSSLGFPKKSQKNDGRGFALRSASCGVDDVKGDILHFVRIIISMIFDYLQRLIRTLHSTMVPSWMKRIFTS